MRSLRLLTGILFLLTAAQAQEHAASLPQEIGQCVSTSVISIADRFGHSLSPSPSKGRFDPGTSIQFSNGGFQVSYDREPAIFRSKIGDQVQMCLTELPKGCPPGDTRGRVYKTKNARTGEAWMLPDSQHSCGGA
jgi:hypothetical protein